MAVAINKSIEINGLGGASLQYWQLYDVAFSLKTNEAYVTMVPFLNEAANTKPTQRALSRTYVLTFAQAGVGSSNLGGKNVGNFLRDTILNWLLNNESDFSGGTLV